MKVLEGTYELSAGRFVKIHAKDIRHLPYTEEEAKACIDYMNNGVFQRLKIYVIDGKLYTCCKLIAIVRDFFENKFADKEGRYFKDYASDERYYITECVKFDYMKIHACSEEEKQMLVRLIEYIP